MSERTPRIPRRWRTPLVVAVVAAAHLGVFAVIARFAPPAPAILPPPFDVFLVGPLPVPPPPPPLPQEPAREVGGGAPAAPSRVHVPRTPAPVPRELPAPPTPAPEQPLVVGASPEAGPTPGQGRGGEGTGSGGGSGAGTGPGSGTVRARLISAPTGRELSRLRPRGARGAGRAIVTCRVRLDTRMEACRLMSETPPGAGFGEAGLQAALLYRFQPPSRNGRPESGDMTVVVEFP